MAIQNRRGAYTNFDPTKMLPGEYAIVLSGDPSDASGYAVYMCFASGVVKRLALDDNVANALNLKQDELTFDTTPRVGSTNPVTSGGIKSALTWTNISSRPAIKPGNGANSTIENSATSANGNYAHAEGYYSHADGLRSHAEGNSTTASGDYSHSEGSNTIASMTASHAEGTATKATANYAHAEGSTTEANGANSHTEGYRSKANGGSSHAEGSSTIAGGSMSHAEGFNTQATANYSHAEGQYTITDGRSQHVAGEYNAYNSSGSTTNRGTYVEIIGNGTSDSNRSNARTLDWNGNEVLSGNLTASGGTITVGNVPLTAAQLQSLINGNYSFTDPNNDGNIVISAQT